MVTVEIVDELTKRVTDESTNGVFVEFPIGGTTVDFVVEVNDEWTKEVFVESVNVVFAEVIDEWAKEALVVEE